MKPVVLAQMVMEFECWSGKAIMDYFSETKEKEMILYNIISSNKVSLLSITNNGLQNIDDGDTF